MPEEAAAAALRLAAKPSRPVQHLPRVPLFSSDNEEDLFTHNATSNSTEEANMRSAPLEPKVMVPYDVRIGETPRKVQIERRKRQFASHDLLALLSSSGVGRLSSGGSALTTPPSPLDLCIFDDDDAWETRGAEEWGGNGTGRNPAKGVKRDGNGVVRYVDCHVVGADVRKNAFEVEWDATRERQWLPRIDICFQAEDPVMYVKRVAEAYALRARTESLLRYNLYLDCMPTDDVNMLTPEQVNRLLVYTLNTKSLKDKQADTAPLLAEVRLDYARAMNKIAFDGTIGVGSRNNSNNSKRHRVIDPEMLVDLGNDVFPEEALRPTPECATVQMPAYDFTEQLSEFSFRTFLTKSEVLVALNKVRVECLKVSKQSLLSTYHTKSLRLEEFEQTQAQTQEQAASHLKDSWVVMLKNSIRNAFKDVGKGWFNLHEKNLETYQGSKLKRFLTMVRFMMEDAVRYLLEDNLARYCEFLERQCGPPLTVVSTNEVVTATDATSFKANKKPPLFALELVAKDGTGFAYNTPLSAFEPAAIKVFDSAITSLGAIPQLEPHVMESIFFSLTPTLNAMHLQEPEVCLLRELLSSALRRSVADAASYLLCWTPHEELLRLDPQAYLQDVEERLQTLAEKKAEIDRLKGEWATLDKNLPVSIAIGPFLVSCKKVRDTLLLKKSKLVELVIESLARAPRRLSNDVCKRADDMLRALAARTATPEDVAERRRYIDGLPGKVGELTELINEAQVYYDALDTLSYLLPEADLLARWGARAWPGKLERAARRATQTLDGDQERYRTEMSAAQEGFAAVVAGIEGVVSGFGQYGDLAQVDFVASQVTTISEQLAKAEEDSRLFNSREALFGLPPTDYSNVRRLIEQFDPFAQLWQTAANWTKWQTSWFKDPFASLNPDAIEKSVAASWKAMYKVSKIFAQKELEACAKNCETVRLQLEQFKPNVPLILALRNPGMRDRHWKVLSEQLGIELQPDDKSFTLAKALDMGLLGHLDTITRICDNAGKEYAIEQALDKMENEWKTVEITVMDYRESGTYVIKVDEAVAQQLDDHLVLTQSLGFSPYKKPFAERIEKWESTLALSSEILEQWLALQRAWMYLEPIFGSPDIQHQLPVEGKRFATVDRIWRKALAQAKSQPHLLTACGSRKLLDSFSECNRSLETVQKGLADYLETKRVAFSRFFFLSNDELLQILSQTKNPLAVQPHLRKCFEAIADLDFNQPDLLITAMNSAEREKVPFDKPMYPKGSVECWLGEVETTMRHSVRAQIELALKDYVVKERPAWVQSWPAMAVLAVGQTYWTREVEGAIRAGELKKYLEETLAKQLYDLTDLVRGNLTTLARLTLGALIVIDVHARDVVAKMVDEGVKAVTDFEWVSQLRYHWEDDEVAVKMVQASLAYGYEYLGNTARLVITPLTDRCYMTLMGALHLNLGGAPAGPAGTGKTETTKDLAKAMAKQCVVFNCSDGLDYLAMGKFFKGLASSGAWACFDEFNRIDLEVLSVVAQQILTIQLAIQSKLKRFLFEDSEIALDPSCSVYITMNPGYAGRSELPDNLKALFRPCAMMVPDYALIGEISLYSFGFKDAKNLARKMVATFKLCSEQLSSQDHYDYGMRAVKSVITAAGNLKRDFPDENEDVLLLRGLRDINVPKFLSHDLPLFSGIISDLFPGVAPPKVEYDDLLRCLSESCSELGIQPVDAFITKVIQLYETTLVRHGLMLVGPTGGGKTMCYRSLAKTMNKLKGTKAFQRARIVCLNPKSITMGQLYGEFDESTHEWTDGVLACHMRECAEDDKPDKKWIMFDGPVDAIWIENMNTVLDDNKKLCLVSGEIIQLSTTMTMMFEVEDLAVASPATVSRCGMVYMEPGALGTKSLLDSWLQRLPTAIKPHGELLAQLFTSLVPDALFYIRRSLRETVATTDNNLILSLFSVMDSLLTSPNNTDNNEGRTANLPLLLPPLFLFALAWSLGAALDRNSRTKFDAFVRERCRMADGVVGNAVMPSVEKTVYEWCYDADKMEWVEWMQTVPEYRVNPDKPFAEIIVPTADTVRYTYVIDKLLRSGKHVLCVGETGTGKTLNISDKLMNHMDDDYVPLFLTFSARTSANQTQDLIDSKMEKRRKGVYGPPSGKRFVILVDDMNMPQREKYFAQPPIEILRQWMDHQGWYERKPPCAFRQIVDVQFIGCMGPPGGGRNPVTNRFLRHFNFLSFTEMSDESVLRIFSTILGATLSQKFSPDMQDLRDPIVAGTIMVYNAIRAELLPTPSRSHYTFNLRDLAKVVQGVLRADPQRVQGPKDMLCLWLHEATRVFQDRLVNEEDRDWFKRCLTEQLNRQCGLEWDEVVTTERLLYGDFLQPGADPRIYQQVTDMDSLVRTVQEYLDDYNSVSNAPMRLVLFLDAIEHVARVCRVIRLPLGNALLLGVGGSGRQSLTKLATYMEEFELFQIEIAKGYGASEWRDDLKRVLKLAGVEGKSAVFLFSDTQIVRESFLEDMNNILNSGEVPNLWGSDDLESITSSMRPVLASSGYMGPITKMSLYAAFVARVRSNLHVVLCMSPVGDAFRTRLRMFPALVNCCTIDWFSEWPQEALRSVARSFLADVELAPASSSSPDSVASGVVEACVGMHQSVERASKSFYDELRRYNYVTPTSYLELLTTFIKMVGEKRDELTQTRRRLEIGLDKLLSTAAAVEDMQRELTNLQPVLAQTGKDVEDMMVVIERDKGEAGKTKEVVALQEAEANRQAAEAQAIADSAQRDLDAALPALDAAVASLKNLSRNDIVEVKSLRNPPEGVKLVMEATCIMFQIPPKMVNDPAKVGKKVPDYWEASTKLLNDPNKFLDSLMQYDKDNISDSIIVKIEPYISMESFTVDQVARVSKACTSICMWARAMYTYHGIAKAVAPKRAQLAQAQAQLDVTLATLAEAQGRLREVEEKLAGLEAKFQEALKKKADLAKQVSDCEVKLERAGKLIGGLGGERLRWTDSVASLSNDLINVVGDVTIAAAAVAYSGPFTPGFRTRLEKEWQQLLVDLGIPHTKDTNLRMTLQNPVKIRAWTIAGLPSDAVSIENGIIVSKARRWPLMIDPQGQANKWVKNMERGGSAGGGDNANTSGGLDVIKLSDKDFLRTLENGVRLGRAVLLENILETLDPALEPLLLKQTFKQGGGEVIKIGDNIIPYHSDFRFYMTTKLRNPHYPPEVSVKVSLLNFFVTPEGLEDQLLGQVVEQERPDLAEQKSQLVVSNAKMKKELKEIEDRILFLLSNAQGDILDDETLINTLAQSKLTSNEITVKVAEAERTEVAIDTTRESYRPVAARASLLFFCIADLTLVDPMYQYSLTWFIALFVRGINEAEKSSNLEECVVKINDHITYLLYVNVCRSLFEQHKLMFSFLLCIKILQHKGQIDPFEWRFLLAGATSTEVMLPNPAPEWLIDKAWIELVNLSRLPAFAGFDTHMAENAAHYRRVFDSADAHREPLASPWEERLNQFQKMLVLRCLRVDKVQLALSDFVSSHLLPRFVDPPPFDLAGCFRDASPSSPLIFVLSAGADPMADLLKLAEEMRFGKKFEKVSLGQGQGPKAERLLTLGMDRGMWVCLQNCHLAASWMPTLERIVENIQPDKVHKDFRLWLTSMPSAQFPVSILQNGVKMTLEPPRGLKSNLARSYGRVTDKYLAACEKPEEWRKLLFGICLFHAVIQERRKFGPLGWNIRYDFTEGDLGVCQTQMRMLLNEYESIPFKVIRFLCAEINYGGRVTDDKDRRLINNLLVTFVNDDVVANNNNNTEYSFSASGAFKLPVAGLAGDVKGVFEHIRALPAAPKPDIFGLHDNADITSDQNETYALLATVLSLQPRVSAAAGGISREAAIEKACTDILGKVPALFDSAAVASKYPATYRESMNTVLAQECIRYNGLLQVMKRSLQDALKALKGLVVMSNDLEMVCNSIYDNQVPDMWAQKAYPSLKPLSSWVNDLLERCEFVSTWIKNGPPPVYWISGFFFPQAFLTGTLQNYARKYVYAIDTVQFAYVVLDDKSDKEITAGPEDGCYIRGLFLEGARWDATTHMLGESHPKELYTDMPVVWLRPEQNANNAQRAGANKVKSGGYDCPVYKTLTRAGTLSTTGHSTNFVMYIELPTDKPQKHWINRGVALFSSLMF